MNKKVLCSSLLMSCLFLCFIFSFSIYAEEEQQENYNENLIYSSNSGEDINGEILSYPRNQLDQMTVIMWIKLQEKGGAQNFFSETKYAVVNDVSYENAGRSLGVNALGEWVFQNQKKQQKIKNEVVLYDKWNFVAIVFDNINNQNRLVINDTVHPYYYLLSNRIKTEGIESKFVIDGTNCSIQDVKIYNTILTLEEIEKLKGEEIKNNRKDYAIIDKSEYVRNNMKLFSSIIPNTRYKVISTYLHVERSPDTYKEYVAQLVSKDKFTVQAIEEEKECVQIITEDGIVGYIGAEDFQYNVLPEESSKIEEILFFIKNLPYADNSYKILGIHLLLFSAFTFIIAKIGMLLYYKGAKYRTPIKVLFFPSAAVMSVYLVTSLFSENEAVWFIKEGFKLFPHGYTSIYHWVLFTGIICAFLVWIGMVGRLFWMKCWKEAIGFGILAVIGNISFIYILQVFLAYILNFHFVIALCGMAIFLAIIIYILKGSVKYFFTISEQEEINDSWQNNYSYQYKNHDYHSDTKYHSDKTYHSNTTYHSDESGQSQTAAYRENFFKGVRSKEEAKKRYRELMKIYHPDNECGDNNITQIIQEEYEEILQKFSE